MTTKENFALSGNWVLLVYHFRRVYNYSATSPYDGQTTPPLPLPPKIPPEIVDALTKQANAMTTMNHPTATRTVSITTLPPPRRSIRQASSIVGTRRSARALKKRHQSGGQIYGQDYGILPSD